MLGCARHAIASASVLVAVSCADAPTPSETESAPIASETQASEDTESEATQDAVAMDETGWLTVGTDGAVQTTFFDPDGRYRDYRNGELVAEGGWQRRADETLCFEPESGRGECWETEAPDEAGVALATNGEGRSIEIRRITYIPPEDNEAEPDTDR